MINRRSIVVSTLVMLLALIVLAPNNADPPVAGVSDASAQEEGEFGICHASTVQYIFIDPDSASFEAHLRHIGQPGGDRFATEEEAQAARQRLIRRFPGSDDVWIINREITAQDFAGVQDWAQASEE